MPSQIVIAGNQEGLRKDLNTLLLPDGAYPTLENAYIFRQRLIKKPGHISQGRLTRTFTALVLNQTANGATTTIPDLLADTNVIAFGATTVRADQPNAQIRCRTAVSVAISITVGAQVFTEPFPPDGTLSGGAGGSSINYATGAITLNFAPPLGGPTPITITFGYHPLLPGTGIWTQEQAPINEEETIVFDTRYAYRHTASGWDEVPSVAATNWTGASENLFWSTNYRGTVPEIPVFWTTNNVDPIRYYDGTTWTNFTPDLVFGGGVTLQTALLITPFKGRLLVFSTLESGTATPFRQRCRFSQSALVGAPTDLTNGWVTDVPGRGGFVDAPTSQAIISIQNLKDRLIVYFERSTWELVYTGNEVLPFYFREINKELGSESTFSTIPFDNGILGVGNVGIHTCNGVNVARIDAVIPDEVYNIQNGNEGPQRVSGTRDYIREVAYWTYPDFNAYSPLNSNPIFPNRVFLYNYRDNTWAILKESFTFYGPYQSADDFTWDTLPYLSWDAWDVPWNEGLLQSRVPDVLAVNQQGFTMIINNQTSANDVTRVIDSFPAASTIRSINHNMEVNDYFVVKNILGTTLTQNEGFNVFKVTSIVNANDFTFDGIATGTYLGCGEIIVLSNFLVESKTFNNVFLQAQSMRLTFADINFDRTGAGQISMLFYMNNNQINANQPLGNTAAIPTTANPLIPLNASQDTIWYRKFANAVGQTIQFDFTLTDEQMRQENIAQEDVVINAVILSVEKSGRLGP